MKIFSIFQSINGEVNREHQGSITTFIRFAGCNLRCNWCDTARAQDPCNGKRMKFADVLNEVHTKNVTITGGEPLLQEPEVHALSLTLAHKKHLVSIETNGSLKIPYGWPVSWVVDWKTPSSGMKHCMKLENFIPLTKRDFVKFVIADDKDFCAAIETIRVLKLDGCKAKFAMSPLGGGTKAPGIDGEYLYHWMLKEPICLENSVILSLQIHRVLGLREDS